MGTGSCTSALQRRESRDRTTLLNETSMTSGPKAGVVLCSSEHLGVEAFAHDQSLIVAEILPILEWEPIQENVEFGSIIVPEQDLEPPLVLRRATPHAHACTPTSRVSASASASASHDT
jgi:hypothetical protein